jgi:arabinogalactan endo-1,4-beta-galactosidase
LFKNIKAQVTELFLLCSIIIFDQIKNNVVFAMKIKIELIITLIFVFNICIKPQSDFIKGVDLSTLLQIEDNGGVFKENGIAKDPILIFKNTNR